MTVKVLTNNDFAKIDELKKEFNVFRVLDVKSKGQLEAVEFFNKDGAFRGFGKNTKEAFKKATKVLTKYYAKKS